MFSELRPKYSAAVARYGDTFGLCGRFSDEFLENSDFSSLKMDAWCLQSAVAVDTGTYTARHHPASVLEPAEQRFEWKRETPLCKCSYESDTETSYANLKRSRCSASKSLGA